MNAEKTPLASRITVCFLIAIFSSGAFAAITTLPIKDSVLSKMHYVDSHFIKRWPTPACTCLSGNHASNIWTRGAYFEGHMALYRMTPDTALYNYAVNWGNGFKWTFNGGNEAEPMRTVNVRARPMPSCTRSIPRRRYGC